MRNKSPHNGFTLIEVIIAVMILAFSLTTLLSLQASSTDQAIRTKNKQHAMLMARKIMSAIELQGPLLRPTTITGTPEQILERYLTPDVQEKKGSVGTDKTVLPLTAELTIAYWSMQGLPEKSIQKVTLRVSWSQNTADVVEIVYFVPAEVIP